MRHDRLASRVSICNARAMRQMWIKTARAQVSGALAATMLTMTGCRLIDQTSFGGAPRPPAPDELAAALVSNGTTPLLVIRPADGVSYDQVLRHAVQSAEARNGEAHWRLVSVVPAQGALTAQQAALDATAVAARQVLDAMGFMGVAPDRVMLSGKTEPGLLQPEIRLFQG